MKVSAFMNKFIIKNQLLLHHSLYNTSVKINNSLLVDEVSNWTPNKKIEKFLSENFYEDLLKLGFLVNDDIDEYATANYFFQQHLDSINIFMIVTQQCNFRCPYCFQDHKKGVMSLDVYKKSKDFLLNTLLSLDFRTKNVDISWFGGEPLLEVESIIDFMSSLKEESLIKQKNINIRGLMSTNGYLLTTNIFERLVLSGVNYFQITIDGLAETHNKSRYLANKKESWDTIINNLINIKKTNYDFRIVLRTNYTKEIFEKFPEYLKFISENFGDDSRFQIYFEAVKDYGTISGEGEFSVFEDESASNKQLIKLVKDNSPLSLELANKHYHTFKSLCCYAANPYQIAIDYDGTLKKCTFDLDNPKNIVGNLFDIAPVNLHNFASWTNYKIQEKCYNCSVYPVCFGKKCPNTYPHNNYCKVIKQIYNTSVTLSYLNL